MFENRTFFSRFFHFGPFLGPFKVGIVAISVHQIIPPSFRIPEHVSNCL